MANWSREFPGKAEYLAEARRFTRAVLRDCEGSDVVESVANELAANAIQHSRSGRPGGGFSLHLTTSANRCQIRVVDQGGPKSPVLCELNEKDVSGRGLAMVELMSESWGVEGNDAARSVWAVVAFGGVAGR